jgi:hypothetical protein
LFGIVVVVLGKGKRGEEEEDGITHPSFYKSEREGLGGAVITMTVLNATSISMREVGLDYSRGDELLLRKTLRSVSRERIANAKSGESPGA